MPFSLNSRFVCAMLAFFAWPAVTPAQQATPPQPANDQSVATLHMQAREVLLPVTVRDKHGALVTTLQKSDFTLTEDGRPQVIKSFTRESNLPFAGPAGGYQPQRLRRPGGGAQGRGQVCGPDAAAGIRRLRETLGAKAVPSGATTGKDQAFLLHFDREVELLQDFTTSRDKLHHEIDEMGPSSQSQNDSQGPETTGDDREQQRPQRRGGTQLYDAIFPGLGRADEAEGWQESAGGLFRWRGSRQQRNDERSLGRGRSRES